MAILIIKKLGCCALRDAFANQGIPPENNIFENSEMISVNLKELKDDSLLYEWLRIATEELHILQNFPEILFCGHARKDHEVVLQKFIALIFSYLSTKDTQIKRPAD